MSIKVRMLPKVLGGSPSASNILARLFHTQVMPAPDVSRRDAAMLEAMKEIARIFGKADEFYLFREYLSHLRSEQKIREDTRHVEEEFRREVPYWVKELVMPLAMLYDVGYADGVKVGKSSS